MVAAGRSHAIRPYTSGCEPSFPAAAERFKKGRHHRSKLRHSAIPWKLLDELEQEKQTSEIREKRLMQVGTGARSEKIRTYNWKDARCTDHRLGQNFALDKVLSGGLEPVIAACVAMDEKEKLEQKKKVDDLFGVAEAGEYDHYEDQYDDFF